MGWAMVLWMNHMSLVISCLLVGGLGFLVGLIERRLDLSEEGEALRVELMLWLKRHMLTQEGAQVRGLVCRPGSYGLTLIEVPVQ
jgi:hypothetical protein